MHLYSDSNVFGFRGSIKQCLSLGFFCQRNFALLSDDAEIPLKATKPIFKTKLSVAAWGTFVALTTLAYCVMQSQTSLYILHMSSSVSHVGMKQSRIQGTEESLMQKTETLVNLVRKLFSSLSVVSLLQGKVRTLVKKNAIREP